MLRLSCFDGVRLSCFDGVRSYAFGPSNFLLHSC